MLKCQNLMRVSDENESMTVWNYTGDLKDESNKYRGCITDKKNKIICPSLGYTYEYYIDTKEDSREKFKNFENWSWFYSPEGTMLRLFYFQGDWHIVTHKKLSAFQSRWSCNFSFGELFIQALEKIIGNVSETQESNVYETFVNHLDKGKIYYFMLRSNYQNRVICHTSTVSEKDSLIFIGHRETTDFQFFLANSEIENEMLRKIRQPLQVEHKFSNIDSVFHFVEKSIDPFEYQGLIGFCKDEFDYHMIKIVNSRYKELIKIRGNNHNLKYRYIEIRNDPTKVEKLFMLYPKYVTVFQDFEKILTKISKKISRTYVDRYIHCKYVTLPKEEYIILRKCNEWCIKNNEKYVSVKTILNIINMESSMNVYKMIQRFRTDEQQRKTYQVRVKKTNTFDDIISFYNMTENSSDGSLPVDEHQ